MRLKEIITLATILLSPFIAFGQFTKNKDSVLKVLKDYKKSDSVQVINYSRASQLYNQKPDSAIYYIKAGLILAEKINFQRGIAILNQKLGTFYIDNGNHKKADSVLRIALNIYKNLNRSEDLSIIYQTLSAVYSGSGDELNSLKYILAATQIAEKRGLKEQLPFCYGMIGIGYQNQGDLVNAMKYLVRSLKGTEDLRQHHTFSTPARAYYNLVVQSDIAVTIADIYTNKKNYALALSYYGKAIKASKEGGFYDTNVVLFINAADVYRKLGNIDRSRSLLDTAMRLADEANLYREKYQIYAGLGMLESSATKGFILIDKAIKLAAAQPTDLMAIYQYKADYAAEKGSFEQAYTAFKNYTELKDSVSGIDKAKQIANLKSVNELQQSKIKMQTLSLENFKAKLNGFIITVISILLLVLLAIGIFYYRKLKLAHRVTVDQKKDLELLNAMKDKIFYIVGHDLRGPLASVTSLTELMEMEFEDQKEVTEYLGLIRTKQKHAMDILDKLLGWGKLEFQRSVSASTFLVLPALEISLQGIRSGAAQKQVNLIVDIPPSLEIKGEANHVDFIVRNLLQNALKFTPSGGKISLLYSKDTAKYYHTLILKDTGIGMSSEQLSKLMTAEGENTPGTANETGIGIGLMLVKKIADQNQHIITVESSMGKGTTFYYQIPY